MEILIWIGVTLVVIVYSGCIIATSVFCRSSQWPKTVSAPEFLILQSQSNCNRPQLDLAAGQGVFSTASDIYVLVLPVNLIWHLPLSRRRRVGICAILLTGLLATACSVGTLYTRFSQRGSIDFTWDSTLNIIFGGIELQVGVICNCMPVSFIVFKRIGAVSWTTISRFLNSHGRQSASSDSGSSHELKAAPESSAFGAGAAALPNVPRPALPGFRTLLRANTGRENPSGALQSYGELHSVDEDYHAQLKSTWGVPTPPSLHHTGNPSVPGGAV
ncbi:hypothetical protein E8E14_012804 [Neopestalotiopsis sp. 37M]|nr:hypothetical protein E8E14_012804 [Neopestalotiopsis sp. 37M]